MKRHRTHIQQVAKWWCSFRKKTNPTVLVFHTQPSTKKCSQWWYPMTYMSPYYGYPWTDRYKEGFLTGNTKDNTIILVSMMRTCYIYKMSLRWQGSYTIIITHWERCPYSISVILVTKAKVGHALFLVDQILQHKVFDAFESRFVALLAEIVERTSKSPDMCLNRCQFRMLKFHVEWMAFTANPDGKCANNNWKTLHILLLWRHDIHYHIKCCVTLAETLIICLGMFVGMTSSWYNQQICVHESVRRTELTRRSICQLTEQRGLIINH